jgi:steroid Delta-isomerase
VDLDDLTRFYQELTPASLACFPKYYTEDAWFKDPFNEVRGVAAIRRIFAHMFEQVDEPRFLVTERFADDYSAMLVWEFRFIRRGRREIEIIRGVSHLHFADDGRVAYHRDYWDGAEVLYEKLPLVGALIRLLRRRGSARQRVPGGQYPRHSEHCRRQGPGLG